MLKNDHYTYRVTWVEEDGEYVGLCVEFPSLSWLASEPEVALQGIRQVVADVVADLQANGEPIPEPLAVRKYSGRFMVRIPPDLHRRLALEAAESGVSLNRLAADKLSSRKFLTNDIMHLGSALYNRTTISPSFGKSSILLLTARSMILARNCT